MSQSATLLYNYIICGLTGCSITGCQSQFRGRWLARTNPCRSTNRPPRPPSAPAVARDRIRWRSVLALLSALATFLVLSGLTPLPPTHNVVVSSAWHQRAALPCPDRHHRARSHPDRAGAARRPRRRAASRADRQPVRDHRRGADHPGRDRRHHHARSRPRPVLLGPHQGDHRKFADRSRKPICRNMRR